MSHTIFVDTHMTLKNYLEKARIDNYEVKNMRAHLFDDRVHFACALTTTRTACLREKIMTTDALTSELSSLYEATQLLLLPTEFTNVELQALHTTWDLCPRF